MMKELALEKANDFLKKNPHLKPQFGHCEDCIKQNWDSKSEKQVLFNYQLKTYSKLICESHIGCMELGKHFYKNTKESPEQKEALRNLVEEGRSLFNSYMQ